MVKKLAPYFIIVFFAAFGGYSLLHSGFPPTHDGEYHIMRFWQFEKVINDGAIFPRWAPDFNNGYGIPLFTYQYPLPNYAAYLFSLFGASLIDSFKLNLFFAHVFSAVFFYLWTRRFWGELGGITSSIFYSFAPYRFVDIFVRGSVGEVWALAMFPAFLWSFTSYIDKPSRLSFLFSVLFLALGIYSHNILALMFFIFSVFYIAILIRDKRKKIFQNSLLIISLGLGLASPFFIPALFEKNLVTALSVFDLTLHFPDLYQLLIPSWGTGFSGITSSNPMSFQIGIANLLVIFISIIVFLFFRKRAKHEEMVLFMIVSFFVVFFLMLSVSITIWKIVPLLNYFQFPWRLLSLEIVITAFLSGTIVSLVKSFKRKLLITVILSALVIISTISYAKFAYYHDRTDEYYLSRPNFTDGTNSIGNSFNTIWLNRIPDKRKKKIEILNGKASIERILEKSNRLEFVINAREDMDARVNIAYFPNWKAYINGKKTSVINNKGIINIKIPEGKNEIILKYESSGIEKTSYVIFLISIIVLILSLNKLAIIKKQ